MNIYVGNISWSASDDDLYNAFAAFGAVDSAQIIYDRETGRSRGFGFVEMPNDEEGQKAIAALNGQELMGRPLKVNEARPRNDRRGGGGFRSGGGGGGGGGGYRSGGGGGGRRY